MMFGTDNGSSPYFRDCAEAFSAPAPQKTSSSPSMKAVEDNILMHWK
jgi:hypothetical protein